MKILDVRQGEKLDVLVVDDDEAGLCDLTASLKRAGLTCTSARSGREALETLSKGPLPSVMVTDIRMPDLDGLELAQRLKEMRVARLPEIIFISGNAGLGHAVDALRLRARDLLTKPVDLGRLIQIVKDIRLERQPASLSIATSPRPPRPGGRPTPAYPGSVDVEAMSASVLNNIRKLQRIRVENLPPGLAVEASWEILLDLYVSEQRREHTSLTAVGGSTGVPLTSALRRIRELESKGLVGRTPDERDRRRAAAHLTAKGREAVQSFIRSYVASCSDADLHCGVG